MQDEVQSAEVNVTGMPESGLSNLSAMYAPRKQKSAAAPIWSWAVMVKVAAPVDRSAATWQVTGVQTVDPTFKLTVLCAAAAGPARKMTVLVRLMPPALKTTVAVCATVEEMVASKLPSAPVT